MVILRSGKDVPFLGKNIPKRHKKQAPGQLLRQQLSNDCQNSDDCQNLNTLSTTDATKSSTSNLTKHSQISTCPTINTSNSVVLERTQNFASEDASMVSDSDSEITMIDDTLEITNYEDSRYMNQSNLSSSNSQATDHYSESTTSYQCEIINDDARQSIQSNMCGVADLSWF